MGRPGGLAVAGGPLIGGALTDGLSWHWIFWPYVPIGAAAIALSRARLPESRAGAEPVDLPALALLTASTFTLVWGLVQAGGHGWRSVQTLPALGSGLLLGAAFLAWERYTAAPMPPPRLFADRAFSAANATALLMSAALSATVFLIAQYCQLALGYSPLTTGVRLLP